MIEQLKKIGGITKITVNMKTLRVKIILQGEESKNKVTKILFENKYAITSEIEADGILTIVGLKKTRK